MKKQASICEGREALPGGYRGDTVFIVKWRWVGGDTWYYLPQRYTTKSIDRALELSRLVERNNKK